MDEDIGAIILFVVFLFLAGGILLGTATDAFEILSSYW